MNLAMLLQMAADGLGDRTAFGPTGEGMTYAQLFERSLRAGAWLKGRDAERVDLIGLNSEAVPLVLFGSAIAGLPFVPLNYRLTDDRLHAVLSRTRPAVAVVDPSLVERVGDVDGIEVITRTEFLAA